MNILERPDLAISADLFADACRISRDHVKAASDALKAYGDHGPERYIVGGRYKQTTRVRR